MFTVGASVVVRKAEGVGQLGEAERNTVLYLSAELSPAVCWAAPAFNPVRPEGSLTTGTCRMEHPWWRWGTWQDPQLAGSLT